MNILFSSHAMFYCNLGDKSLKDIFTDWHEHDFYIKKQIDKNTILIHSKYSQKVYGNSNIILNYNEQENSLSIKSSPFFRSYILFTIIPLSVLILLKTNNLNNMYFLAPVLFLLFLILMLKWSVIYNKNAALKSIQALLVKNKIKYSFGNST
jgi:hypothetical protein